MLNMANKENGSDNLQIKEGILPFDKKKNAIRLVPLKKLLDPSLFENVVVLGSSDEDEDKSLNHNSVQKPKNLKVKIKKLKNINLPKSYNGLKKGQPKVSSSPESDKNKNNYLDKMSVSRLTEKTICLNKKEKTTVKESALPLNSTNSKDEIGQSNTNNSNNLKKSVTNENPPKSNVLSNLSNSNECSALPSDETSDSDAPLLAKLSNNRKSKKKIDSKITLVNKNNLKLNSRNVESSDFENKTNLNDANTEIVISNKKNGLVKKVSSNKKNQKNILSKKSAEDTNTKISKDFTADNTLNINHINDTNKKTNLASSFNNQYQNNKSNISLNSVRFIKKLKINIKRNNLLKLKSQFENTMNKSRIISKKINVQKKEKTQQKKLIEKSLNGKKEKTNNVSDKTDNKSKETYPNQSNSSSSSESKKEIDNRISNSDDDGDSLTNKQSSEEDDESVLIKPRTGRMSRKIITLSDSSDEDEQINDLDEKDDEDEQTSDINDYEQTSDINEKDDDYEQTSDINEKDDIDESSSNSEVYVKTTRSTRTRKPTKDDNFDYVNDSNSSDNEKYAESDSSIDKKKKKTNKRKRIKNVSDSSDDDDDDEPGSSNKKRKNIRKLIKKTQLNVDTKRAAEIEKERRKRIDDRQKLYNSIYEKPSENIELNSLILDFDEETQVPLLEVDEGILKKLKPHQATGVKFMWDACFETIKQSREDEGSGCILAHCMGLGKTLQVITLTHTLITHSDKTNIERALIITPLSTITNWAREYQCWLRFCENKNIEVYDMSKFKDKTLRSFKLNEWFEEGGVCVIGYDMYRILSNENAKGLRKKQREGLQKALVDPGPDIVICDEGHLLKNEKTSLSQAVTKIRTKRRIVLTGTPLQNNLKEYYCMIQFIKPNLLGTYKEYLNRFVNPITNGQYTDSTERDIRLMKHRSHILHKLLEGCIQRRDYSVLAPYLPPKQEYSVFITMSEIQQKVYEFYMTKQRNYNLDFAGKGAKLFQDFQNLRRIWTHPMCLHVNSENIKKKELPRDSDEEGSLVDFVVNDSDGETTSADSDDTFDSDKTVESVKIVKGRQTKNSLKAPVIEEFNGDPTKWWRPLVSKKDIINIHNSPKLVLLMKILKECETIGDKLLLFSQSLQSLDVIEEFLSLIHRKTNGEEILGDVGNFRGNWKSGIDYHRLDGSSSVENREIMCKKFNSVKNLRARLFLISTRAGSLGINLVAANRVVIFDVSWNPSHDTQSIFRVYRFGQIKPCYIYRFIALGTMEQKIYERQVVKQSTAKRVIDEQQIGRHYNQNDLLELYTYELTPREPREVPLLPKDRLFAELLANYEKLIFKYHEHDSLLENQESDNLSEEERKAAWDEYEIEKVRPPTQPQVYYNRQNYSFGNNPVFGPVTSNKIFGFRIEILLRLLNMKVSVDNPQLSQDQILQMVPPYLQELHKQMNDGNPTMYKQLLELHSQLEMPQGYHTNPLLYANQAPPDGTGLAGNSIGAQGLPTTSTEIVEID